jgi:peptide/nickel transport system substrate-binding protein
VWLSARRIDRKPRREGALGCRARERPPQPTAGVNRAGRLGLSLLLAAALACRAREREGIPAALRPTALPGPPSLGYIDEQAGARPVEGGVIRRRLVADPTTLNPILQSAVPDQQVITLLSRNLLDYDHRLNLVPGLAESFEVSKDAREFLFHLRADAVWEDGSPVTPADAVFTIRTAANPKTGAPIFGPLLEGLESAEAAGPRAFRVRFREPYAYRAMAFVLPLLPEKVYRGKDIARAPENRRPLSNGPYRLASWKPHQSVELVRNERYWGPRAPLDRILFRIVPENATAWAMLLRGELDETPIDAALLARAETDPEFAACCRTVEGYTLDWSYIALNNRSPFFEDARVRRAATMLLDRAAVIRGLFRGRARVISGPFAPESPAYDTAVAPLPHDPEAAARLLDEARWTDEDQDGLRTKDGRRFEIEILVPAGNEIGRQIVETLAGGLRAAGIHARMRTLEWNAFLDRLDSGAYEAAALATAVTDPNPDPYYLWHSSQWPPAGLNTCFSKSGAADALMREARAELDEKKRIALLRRIHALLNSEAPAIFVANTTVKHAFRRPIHGLATSPLGLFGIWPGPAGWWVSGPVPASKPSASGGAS